MADVVFFRYQDAAGRDVITNSLDDVPADQRASVRLYDPSAPREAAAPAPTLDLPSFALGVAVAVPVVLVVDRLLGRVGGGGRVGSGVRLVVLAAVVVGGAGLYFGAVMRTAGLGSGAVAAPTQALDAARAARDQANAAQQKTNDALAE